METVRETTTTTTMTTTSSTTMEMTTYSAHRQNYTQCKIYTHTVKRLICEQIEKRVLFAEKEEEKKIADILILHWKWRRLNLNVCLPTDPYSIFV